MTPIYFGPRERPLFGWLHPGRATETAPIGLVLCNPFGYEAMCTHRTLRTLAETAAAAGIPTLRFDYDGCGDSAGLDTDSGRLGAWLASIEFAVEELKRYAPAAQICLMGIRLGAMLAALAATRSTQVHALVALAPVINGRQYVRELRALAMAGVQSEPPPGTPTIPGMQESAGYALPEELRTELAGVDLSKLDPPPLTHALIIDRSDMPASEGWQKQLAQAGVTVQAQRFDGYVPMMLDPHENVVPVDTINEIVRWVQSDASSRVSAHQSLSSPASKAVATSAEFEVDNSGAPCRVRETPIYLDDTSRLFGIITEPTSVSAVKPRQVALMLNSGGQHHVGPNRMYVRLARLCASRGITAVRVDLSGLGDSGSRTEETGNVVYSRFAYDDVVQIVATLQQRLGSVHVHALGICSGAYHALKAAVRGVPLRSAIVINPLTFFWKDGMTLAQPEFQITSEANRYKSTALQLSAWLKILKGQVNLFAVAQILGRRVSTVVAHQVREAARWLRIPIKDDLASDLRMVVKNGSRVQFVFSGSDPGYSMLYEQGGTTVNRLNQQKALTIDVLQGADHTFTPRWTQDSLLALMASTLSKSEALGQ